MKVDGCHVVMRQKSGGWHWSLMVCEEEVARGNAETKDEAWEQVRRWRETRSCQHAPREEGRG